MSSRLGRKLGSRSSLGSRCSLDLGHSCTLDLRCSLDLDHRCSLDLGRSCSLDKVSVPELSFPDRLVTHSPSGFTESSQLTVLLSKTRRCQIVPAHTLVTKTRAECWLVLTPQRGLGWGAVRGVPDWCLHHHTRTLLLFLRSLLLQFSLVPSPPLWRNAIYNSFPA